MCLYSSKSYSYSSKNFNSYIINDVKSILYWENMIKKN